MVYYPITVGIATALIVPVAIMFLTVRKDVKYPILLYCFAIVMILFAFVPFLIQYTWVSLSFFPAYLIWILPYLIFDSAFYILSALLVFVEVRDRAKPVPQTWQSY
jgi:hypothetical protein